MGTEGSEFPAHGNFAPRRDVLASSLLDEKAFFIGNSMRAGRAFRDRPNLRACSVAKRAGKALFFGGRSQAVPRVPCSRSVSSVMLGGRCSGAVCRAVGSVAVGAWGGVGAERERPLVRSGRPSGGRAVGERAVGPGAVWVGRGGGAVRLTGQRRVRDIPRRPNRNSPSSRKLPMKRILLMALALAVCAGSAFGGSVSNAYADCSGTACNDPGPSGGDSSGSSDSGGGH